MRQIGSDIDVSQCLSGLAEREIGIRANLVEVICVFGLQLYSLGYQRKSFLRLAVERVNARELSERASHQRKQLHGALERISLSLQIFLILSLHHSEVILH